MERKLQLKINSERWRVFGKQLNCMARVQPKSLLFLFVFFHDGILLFQTANMGRSIPLKEEDRCGGWLAMVLPFPELKNKSETSYGFQPGFEIPVTAAAAGWWLDTCPQICTYS